MGKEVLIATIVSIILGIGFLIAIYSMVWAVSEKKQQLFPAIIMQEEGLEGEQENWTSY